MKNQYALNENGNITTRKAKAKNTLCSVTKKNITGKIGISISSPFHEKNVWISLEGVNALESELEEIELESNTGCTKICTRNNSENTREIKIELYYYNFEEPNKKRTVKCAQCAEKHIDRNKSVSIEIHRKRWKRQHVEIHEDCFEDFFESLKSYPPELEIKNTLISL